MLYLLSPSVGVEVTEIEGKPGDNQDIRRIAISSPDPRPDSSKRHGEEMLVKLMTSENEKSHGSMMLRVGAIAFGLGTLIYTGLGANLLVIPPFK